MSRNIPHRSTAAHTAAPAGVRTRVRLFAILLVVLASPPARADIGPPVSVSLAGGARPAAAGERFSDTARFTADRDLVLSNVEIVADPAWQVVSVTDPGPVFVPAGEFVDVPFEVTAVDPDAASLVFAFRFDDLLATAELCLSPRAFAEGQVAQPTGRVEPDRASQPAPADLARPAPATTLDPVPASDGGDKAGRLITVQGRFFYQRPDKKVDGADGITVEVYADGLLRGTVVTDAFGYYSATIFWIPTTFYQDLNPDLRVEFVSDNSEVRTLSTAGYLLRWYSPTVANFSGASLDFGWLKSKDDDLHKYVHGHTVLTRTWRWLRDQTGVDWVKLKLQRASKAGTAFYSPGSKTTYMADDRMWQEITVVHESGHHFLEWHGSGAMGPNQYCNGVCDGDQCGHCTWCVEDAEDAWGEGFPTWIGTMIGRELKTTYGVQPFSMLNFEYLAKCGDYPVPVLDDPLRNEGPFVALLWDIIDANNEDDTLTPAMSGWRDRLTMDTDAIWDVLWGDSPVTPQEFLMGFLGNNGSVREDFWETARNCGYEIDTQDPPAPYLLSSTSHVHGVPSNDGTVDLYWLGALDDASGIAGYSLSANLGGPVAPSQILSFGNVNTFTTFNLPAGNWWFTIRALDRAGRWSSGYATYGPIIISAPADTDLAVMPPAGWGLPLIPHAVSDPGFPPPPPLLLPGGLPVWWNLGVINRGSASTSGEVRLQLRVDGVARDEAVITADVPLRAGETASWTGRGPVVVPGGRHTFGAWLDAGETMAEGDEADNHWAWQWLWAPPEFAAQPTADLGEPPLSTGGWDNLAGGAAGYNVDAVRLRVPAGGFAALALFAADDEADFDLQLHAPSDDPQDGLNTWLAGSGRLAGQLDAVFARAGAGELLADVAVLNYSGHQTPAKVAHVAADPYYLYDQVALGFGADEMLKLGMLTVAAGQEGPVTLRVEGDPADGALSLAWFGSPADYGNLDSWTAYTRTGGAGSARLDVLVETPGQYAFALYRHPAEGRQARQAELRLAPTLPDLQPVAAGGWAAPLVPRPLPDGLPGDVPMPAELLAAPAATYFNLAAVNAGTVAYPPNPCVVRVDGAAVLAAALPSMSTGGIATLNDATSVPVAGGRHTAALAIDPEGLLAEEDELNNTWGRQWVWTPPALAAGAAAVVIPPDPSGDWDAISDPGAAGVAANCAGFRFGGAAPGGGREGQWVGFAVAPAVGEDCDLALHETSTGAEDGFLDPLAFSGWPADDCDYVLVNHNRTAVRAFDAGVRRFDGGATVLAGAAASTFLGSDPSGGSATFSLPAVQGLALHEVRLSPGVWRIRLENLDGQVDYGLAVHPGQQSLLTRSLALPDGAAWQAGPGADEEFVVRIDETDYYCVAVWKRGGADWALAGSYRLVFEPNVSPVPDPDVPLATRIESAGPNPFNPRLEIAYTVGRTGPVSLGIYDVQGRLVRQLLSGVATAGVHRAVWDGCHTGGRAAASGSYLLRLQGVDGGASTRRVTLLR